MDEYVFWSPEAAGNGGQPGLRGILVKALADTRDFSIELERHAEDPAADLEVAVAAEQAALDAVAGTDRALVALVEAEPHLMGRQALADIGAELEVASRALDRYAQARLQGDRSRMVGAARALHRACTLAMAVLDEAELHEAPPRP